MTDSIAQTVLQKYDLTDEDMSGETRNGIGLVAPFDFALDDEYYKWLGSDIPMFITRTPELLDPNVTVDLAKQVSSELAVAPAVSSLLAVQPAAIGYACTSGSFVEGVDGDSRLRDIMIQAGARQAVTTSSALAAAVQVLGIKKIAIITPYNYELSALLIDFLAECDVKVVTAAYFDREQKIARIGIDVVKRIALEIDIPEAEAIFFSCTNLHTYEIIEELEAQLGKPVLSANQVTVWATLKAADIDLPPHNQKLFQAA